MSCLTECFYFLYLSAYENEELIALPRVWHSVYGPSLQASGVSSVHGLLPKPTLPVPIERFFEHILLIVQNGAKLNGVFLMRKGVWIPINMLQLM